MFLRMTKLCFVLLTVSLLAACGSDDDDEDGEGSFPDEVTKKVAVFGIDVIAAEDVDDEDLLHVASVLGEYLDSNEDGTANDTDVTTFLAENDAIMAVFQTSDDVESQDFGSYPGNGDGVVTVAAEEIVKEAPSMEAGFDPTLEEVLHLVTSRGYSRVYADEMGEAVDSDIADAMDTARGGRYTEVPDSYPDDAWYTYDDDGCEYSCMVTEYTYWGITSLLGAQSFDGRLEQIENEWALNTADKVEETDTALYEILTNEDLNLPTALPNGTYDGSELEVEEI